MSEAGSSEASAEEGCLARELWLGKPRGPGGRSVVSGVLERSESEDGLDPTQQREGGLSTRAKARQAILRQPQARPVLAANQNIENNPMQSSMVSLAWIL